MLQLLCDINTLRSHNTTLLVLGVPPKQPPASMAWTLPDPQRSLRDLDPDVSSPVSSEVELMWIWICVIPEALILGPVGWSVSFTGGQVWHTHTNMTSHSGVCKCETEKDSCVYLCPLRSVSSASSEPPQPEKHTHATHCYHGNTQIKDSRMNNPITAKISVCTLDWSARL